jgi:hypothetical protein
LNESHWCFERIALTVPLASREGNYQDGGLPCPIDRPESGNECAIPAGYRASGFSG